MKNDPRKDLTLRWVGDEALDRVADTRMRCYAPGLRDLPRFADGLRADTRAKPGDFLLAEAAGQAIGTTTAISLTMWVRGALFPCQGVAYVGTIKTQRRRGGIASALMRETLNKARERGEVLSALMPFRASFYEHFGYGVVECQGEWTLPLAILPPGDFDGIRFYDKSDFDALCQCKQRIAQAGQCDIERSPGTWEMYLKKAEEGFTVVDRPDPAGPVHGWITFLHASEGGKDLIRAIDRGSDSPAAFERQLHFLASLKDQYAAATLILPADFPLNWLLLERQVPHRLVNHPTAAVRPFTRMQVRVLDHARLIGAMHLPPQAKGAVSVLVRETDAAASAFQIEYAAGRATAAPLPPGTSTQVQCTDPVWAAVVLGDLPATRAAKMGLLTAADPQAAAMLDVFAMGAAPFTTEYF
jgi:predicted acetyltransferase